MTDDMMLYESWADVPSDVYLTRTVLADLDMPRRPGPVAATVKGRNWRNKRDVFELHRIDESEPSPATGRRLASRSRIPSRHTCTDCGAHTDLPVTVYQDGARLCRACARIRRLRATQADDAQRRKGVARQAADLLANPLAVLHCQLVQRGSTPSGTPRRPSAVRVTAVDGDGQDLIDITVRLVGARAHGIPAGAVAADEAEPPLRQALAGRRVVRWIGELTELGTVLRASGHRGVIPSGYDQLVDLRDMTMWWRGEMNPVTGHTILPQVPTSAAAKLLLIQQIAGIVGGTAGTPAPATCQDCGSHPGSLSTSRQQEELCEACLHIASIRVAQQDARQRDVASVARAAFTHDGGLAAVHISLIERTSVSGRRLKPTAARITVVNGHDKTILDSTVRLSTRAREVPPEAVTPETVRSALSGRAILTWDETAHTLMHRVIGDIGWTDTVDPEACVACMTLQDTAAAWRRDIDPGTYAPRTPIPPGRADRLLYLLQQVAAADPKGASS